VPSAFAHVSIEHKFVLTTPRHRKKYARHTKRQTRRTGIPRRQSPATLRRLRQVVRQASREGLLRLQAEGRAAGQASQREVAHIRARRYTARSLLALARFSQRIAVNIAKLPELLRKGLTGVPPPLWSRKQRVGLAHEPIGNEADPFLCGPVEHV